MTSTLTSAPIRRPRPHRQARQQRPLPGWLQLVVLLLLFQSPAYDAMNKVQRTDVLGQVTSYLYDVRNRLAHTVYASSAPANSQRDYVYDAHGNLLSVTEPNQTAANVGYTYDALNRALTETSGGLTHTYTYDLAGNRLGAVYGGTNRTITSTYDALNRLGTMTESGRVSSYAYDLNGNIVEKTAPNGDIEAYFYDALNRCSIESAQTGAAVSLFDYTYGYDLGGNVTSERETYPSGLNNRTVTNTYDNIDRLHIEAVTGSAPNVTTTYGYDNANNRISKVITGTGASSTSYTYNNLNQLTSYTSGARTVSLGYDYDGNRVNRLVNGGTDNGADIYSYDIENRMIGLVKGTAGGAGTYAYQYDYRTRRITRDESSASGVLTHVIFGGGTSVQEIDGANTTPTVEFIRGSDYGGGVGGVLYSIRSGTPSYTHANHRGDIIAKTDGSGNLTFQAQYEGFGKQIATSGSTLDRQQANSKDVDLTGLKNENERIYDLEADAFITRDPSGMSDGPNLYSYVRQNPYTYFDPEGLDAQNVSDNDVAAAVVKAQAANPKEQNALGAMVYTAAGRIIQFGANHQDSLKTTQNDIQVGLNVATVGVEGKAAAEASGLLDGAASVTSATAETATAVNVANKDAAAATVPTQTAAATKEGGAYKDLQQIGDGKDANHMPADAASPLSKGEGPAVKMDPEDHAQMSSTGSSKEAKAWRAKQAELIKQGKFQEAQQMDVDEAQQKFGNKYDPGIKQMQDYTKTIPKEKTTPQVSPPPKQTATANQN